MAKPPLGPVWQNSSGGGGGGSPPAPPPPPPPPPPPKKSTVTTGLGVDVDKIASQSPTLQANVKKLQDEGWTIKYGDPGGGSACYKSPDTKKGIKAKTIVIDPNSKGNPAKITQTLAHESGHALYTADPYVPPDGLTRDQYVSRNAMRSLKDEGEATLTNAQIRDEIYDASKTDIGIAGKEHKKYAEIAKKYPNAVDRDTAREEIGKIFAKGENPSGKQNAGKNYEQYYSETFEKYWDKNVSSKK